MSLLAECQSKVLSSIRGASQSTDEFVRGVYARVARNVQYLLNQQVVTRSGFGVAWNPAVSITSMYNWILAAANRIAYFDKTNGRVSLININTAVTVNLLTGISSVEYADFASLGSRIAFALVNSSGGGAQQGRVWDSPTAPATADKAFEPPIAAIPMVLSEPGAGTVSRGTHRFAVIFTTRTGYETRPSPVNSSFGSSGSIADLQIISLAATGNKTARVVMNPPGGTWPAPMVSAALLMTTVQNTARYFFVPGCTATVTGGGAGSVTFPDINVSDTILASAASTEAVTPNKNYFALYSQDSAAAGPFNPFKVVGYSDRCVWFCTLSDGTSGVFVSNKGAAQWITLASHLIQLPEKRQIISGFVLKGTLYLLGPSWTYAVSDNTSLPVTWVPPQEIDGRVGTPQITGVAVNSSLGYAFVADINGLQFFSGGAYAQRPISYLNQPEWARINWGAPAGTVQVVDFPSAKMVLVQAPLDGAVAANYILAWDYANGIAWDKVNYSIWDSSQLADIGAMANVYNQSKWFEVWMSRYSAGKVYRTRSIAAGDATDANPTPLYYDDVAGITSTYETCPLPEAAPEPRNFVALRARIRGNGTILQTAHTSDQTRTATLPSIAVSLAPGRWALTFVDVQTEAVMVSFSNNGVAGAWFVIAGLQPYWTPWIEQR